MKPIVSKIWSSPTMRNVGKLLSANVFAQALGLLVYPILTRLYTPEDFGLMNLFLSIAGVLILLSTLEWYNAIVLPKSDEEGRALVHLSLICVLTLTIVLLLTIPFAKHIANLFNSPDLAKYYWLLPICVALTGIWNILNYWYIRCKDFNYISEYQISQSLFSAGYKVVFGWIPLTGGLIYASILSPLCSLALSIFVSSRRSIRSLLKWDWCVCKEVAKVYRNFPMFSAPRALLNNVVGQLPILVLTPLFGAKLVGFWGMAIMLAFVPISTITRALYQVFYEKTTENVNAGCSIWPFYKRFTFWTLFVVIPAFTFLWFVLPSLTAWLLGDEWRTVGVYIRWMLPWLACSVLNTSTSFLFDVFFKQKQGLYFEILLASLRAIGVGLGVIYENFEMAIAGYSVGSAIANGVQYIWLMRLVRMFENKRPKVR